MQRAALAPSFAAVLLAASALIPTDHVYANGTEAAATAQTGATGPENGPDKDSVADGRSAVASGPDDPQPARVASMEEICDTLQLAATAYELPLPFFVRLIWQESRFRVRAVSHVGARGIAQFMPETAAIRGLADPFDPIQSLHKSADYLRELRQLFGNLGLAAAAYNSGEARVQNWLEGRGGLPSETRNYVHAITGVPVDQWTAGEPVQLTGRIPMGIPCPALVARTLGNEAVAAPVRLASLGAIRARSAPAVPRWSVVIAGSFSAENAKAQSARLQRRFASILNGRELTVVTRAVAGRGRSRMTQVRIAENDRVSAERLCARLRAGGASCIVMRAS